MGMQSMLQWVESKVPHVTHHVDQNHTDNNPYGRINMVAVQSVNPLDHQAQPLIMYMYNIWGVYLL